MRNLFGSGWFWIEHALFAYLSVLFVSSKSPSDGEMHVMSAVSELPPSESCAHGGSECGAAGPVARTAQGLSAVRAQGSRYQREREVLIIQCTMSCSSQQLLTSARQIC
jgi:hypothetical protein